jgi:hypothetical protein
LVVNEKRNHKIRLVITNKKPTIPDTENGFTAYENSKKLETDKPIWTLRNMNRDNDLTSDEHLTNPKETMAS